MVLLWLLECKGVISIWRIRMIFWSYRIGDPSVLTSQKSAQLLIQSTNVCSMKFVRKSFLCGELHVNLDHILELQEHWRSFNLDITGKHCLGFSFEFSAPLPAWRDLFSASRNFCGERYQPGCTEIFWPAEGTGQPVTIFKKLKNSSSPLPRKKTWVHKDLSTGPSAILEHPWPSGLRHRSQITIGPVQRPFSYTKSTRVFFRFLK